MALLCDICVNLRVCLSPPVSGTHNPLILRFRDPDLRTRIRKVAWVQRDETMRSCGTVAQTLMLAAKSMGYDSCPMDGFDFDKVAELIKLPEGHIIAMFVAIGKGTKEPWPRPGQLPLDKLVIQNFFE